MPSCQEDKGWNVTSPGTILSKPCPEGKKKCKKIRADCNDYIHGIDEFVQKNKVKCNSCTRNWNEQ